MHIIERAFDYFVVYMLIRYTIRGYWLDHKLEAIVDWCLKHT